MEILRMLEIVDLYNTTYLQRERQEEHTTSSTTTNLADEVFSYISSKGGKGVTLVELEAHISGSSSSRLKEVLDQMQMEGLIFFSSQDCMFYPL